MQNNLIKIIEFLNLKNKEVTIFFIIFYIVGILGLSFEITNSLFLKLITFALILSFLALTIFHKPNENKKTILIFSIIFLLGFLIEVLGVNTKIIFGDYTYGQSLGFKLFNTPLIIGINWLFLVYTTSSILEDFKINNFLKILFSSGLMLIYDIVLEQVAPKIDMWHWKLNQIPLQNFIAWFCIAFIFNMLIKIFKIRTKNPFAKIILICQFLFFVILLFTI